MFTSTTRLIGAALAVVSVAAVILVSAASAQNVTFHANGAYTYGYYWSPSAAMSLNVTRYNATSTFLYYDVGTPDSHGNWVDRTGYGPIPSGSFKVQGNTYTLSVDTTQLSSDFVESECTYYPEIDTYSCIDGVGGPIAAVFTASKLYSGRSTGTYTSKWPEGKYVTNGTSDYNAASGNVNMLGVTFTSVEGQAGTAHNTSISIVKK